jgi:hypothetical protein
MNFDRGTIPGEEHCPFFSHTMKETGSILTVVLQKSAVGWRITGWAWSKN